MRRILLRSAAFVRAARRLVKKYPQAGPILEAAFESLMEDAFQATLKTHKLKGELAGSWPCSVGYDLRIVFEFILRTPVQNDRLLLSSMEFPPGIYSEGTQFLC